MLTKSSLPLAIPNNGSTYFHKLSWCKIITTQLADYTERRREGTTYQTQYARIYILHKSDEP